MNGKEVQNLSVKERKAMGLGYIPSDRHKDAMVPHFSITENFLLGYQEDPKYCKKGFIDYKALEEDAKVQVEQFEIKIAGVSQHIGQLSGGNQQKVILARELAKKIEEEMEYPGQIKVHVLRETAAIEYAK